MAEAGQSIRLLEKSERQFRYQQASSINESGEQQGVQKNRLGTFFGVYIPTVLGIFGVVIFLRLSWITGQAGNLSLFLLLF